MLKDETKQAEVERDELLEKKQSIIDKYKDKYRELSAIPECSICRISPESKVFVAPNCILPRFQAASGTKEEKEQRARPHFFCASCLDGYVKAKKNGNLQAPCPNCNTGQCETNLTGIDLSQVPELLALEKLKW